MRRVSLYRASAIAAAFATFLLPNAASAAAPGDADPAFTPFTSRLAMAGNESVTAIVAQPDGKSVLAVSNDGDELARIVRLLPTGALDPSFATSGVYTGPVAPNDFTVDQLLLDGSGNIWFGGHTAGTSFSFGRLTSTGALDTSYAAAATVPGISVVMGGVGNSPISVTELFLDGVGRLTWIGKTDGPADADLTWGRLTAAGVADIDYTSAVHNVSSADSLDGAVMLGDGSILGAGQQTGTLTAFTTIVQPDGSSAVSTARDLDPGDDNRLFQIMRVGSSVFGVAVINEGGHTSALVKLDETGALDGTFGTGGVAGFGTSGMRATSLTTDGAGRIIVGGRNNGNGKLFACRLSTAGVLDSAFGTGGCVETGVDTDPGGIDPMPHVAVASFGRVLLAYNGDTLAPPGHVAVHGLVNEITRLGITATGAVSAASPIRPGAAVTSSWSVANAGPDATRGTVALTLSVSAGATVSAVSGMTCPSLAGTTIACTVPTMAVGSSPVSATVSGGIDGTFTTTLALQSGASFDDSSTDDAASNSFTVVSESPQPVPPVPPVVKIKIAKVAVIRVSKLHKGTTIVCGATVAKPCIIKSRPGKRKFPNVFLRSGVSPAPADLAQLKTRLEMQGAKIKASGKLGNYSKPKSRIIEFEADGLHESTFDQLFNSPPGGYMYRVRLVIPEGSTTLASTTGWRYFKYVLVPKPRG